MKRLNFLLIALITFAMCWACSDDDDNFKAPVIGGDTATTVNISTDTVNAYNIIREIQSEAGLKEIILTNKTENKDLNKVTEFANPKDYTFNYNVDLSGYTANTELTLVLSTVDVAGNTTSQEIKLTIIVSEVKIYFQTEDESVSTYFDFYYLPFKIKCGLGTLKSVTVTLNGTSTVMEIKPKISDAFYFDYNAANLTMGDNQLKIEAEDNVGRKAAADITIIRKEVPQGLGNAYLVTSLSKDFGGFVISSRIKDGKIAWFKCEYYDEVIDMGPYGKMPYPFFEYYTFIYNANNTVNKLIYTYNDGTGSEDYTVFEFKYKTENPQQVAEVVTYAGIDDVKGDKAPNAVESVYANNFEYELGNIIKYSVEGNEYTPEYATVEGEQVRVDHMDYTTGAEASAYALSERIENPFYNLLCPAVVVIGTQKLPLDMFFYNKYLFTSLKQGNADIQHYTIEKDNVTGNAGKVIWDGKDVELQFTYK